MFRLADIICSNQFIRKFSSITREMNKNPGAILITRRTGDHFVFLNAGLYELLMEQNNIETAKMEMMGMYQD